MKCHLHARKQSAYIIGNGKNIVAAKRAKPQGQPQESSQDSQPRKSSGHAGIKEIQAKPV